MQFEGVVVGVGKGFGAWQRRDKKSYRLNGGRLRAAVACEGGKLIGSDDVQMGVDCRNMLRRPRVRLVGGWGFPQSVRGTRSGAVLNGGSGLSASSSSTGENASLEVAVAGGVVMLLPVRALLRVYTRAAQISTGPTKPPGIRSPGTRFSDSVAGGAAGNLLWWWWWTCQIAGRSKRADARASRRRRLEQEKRKQ